MMPLAYELALDKMGLTKEEKELTTSMPNAVAYGYIIARRKAGGGKRDTPNRPGLGDIFDEFFKGK